MTNNTPVSDQRPHGAARNVAFYHKKTGLLHGLSIIASDPDAIALNTPPDHLVIDHPLEGALDPLCHRVDVATGEVVPYQPPQPSVDHEWDIETRRWKLNAAFAARQAQRTDALAQIRTLEAAQARPHRELTLDPANVEARKRLESIEGQIAALRFVLAMP
jgi:hypothetical protein